MVGDPIAHSLSPVLHRAGYAALALPFEYDAARVPSGALAAHVAGLGPQWRGLSVTAPLKREALALADEASERARRSGAANTLVRQDERWVADNTDIPGAVAAVRERFDGPLESAVVLGGGATAASVGLALAELGVGRIRLAVRDPGRAAETLATLLTAPSGPDVALVHLTEAPAADIVVSTIPVAAQGPALVERTASAAVVFEVTYNTWPTPVVEAAVARGAVVVSGLDLLVHQAVLQFEQFTGRPGPLDALRTAGERALADRLERDR